MAVIGVFTDIGIEKSREVQNGEGFRIFPESFAVSNEISAGFPTIDSLRGLTAVNSGVFFTGPIASRSIIDTTEQQSINFSTVPDSGDFKLRFENQTTVAIAFNATALDIETALNNLSNVDGAVVTGDFASGFEVNFSGVTLIAEDNQLETGTAPVSILIATTLSRPNAVKVNLEIPPGQAPLAPGGLEEIKEIYLLAKDLDTNDFILAVGRPDTTNLYDNQGQTTLRLTLRILNSDIGDKVVFAFTQATEIETHNQDPNAHQDIRANLEKAGIFEQPGLHEFIGQNFDEFAQGLNRMFDGSVITGDLVYLDIDGQYKRAIADGTIASHVSGMADVDRGAVYSNGIVKIQTGYPESTLVYLHPTNPGQVTDVPSGKPIGQTLDEFNIILRVESQSQVSEYVDTVASLVPGYNHYPTIQEAIDAAPEGGWVRIDVLEELVGPNPIDTNGKQINLLFTGVDSGVKKFEGQNEIQQITFSAIPDSGDFVLTHDGNKTTRITSSAVAGDIETALEALPSINDVTVTGDFNLGFTIEFVGVDGNLNQTQVAPGTSPGLNEIQRLNFDNDDFSSGSFELNFDGQDTNAIAFNQVNATTIKNELELLPNITSVTVTPEASPPVGQTEFIIEFTGVDGLQDKISLSVVNNSLQDSGTNPIAGSVSIDQEGDLPDNLLLIGATPVTAIGNTTQNGDIPGSDKAFLVEDDGVQFLGLGRIENFATAIDLNTHVTTRIEMYFVGNILPIDDAGVVPADFNTDGSIGYNPFLEAIEDSSFRDLVKVTAVSPTPDKTVNISSSEIVLSDGSKHGFIVDQRISQYTGGTIDFATGTITGGGVNFTPYVAATPSHYFKYAIMLKSDDTLEVILPSGDSANANTAPIPTPRNGILRAIVTVQDDGGGGIEDITSDDIVRFHDIGAFPDEYQIREFISAGGSATFDVSSGGTGDNFSFDPNNDVLDIEVFINGDFQTQDRTGGLTSDFRKNSATEIEFADGNGNPFVIPADAKVVVRFKDNLIDRFKTGIVQASFAVAERTGDGLTDTYLITPEISNMSSDNNIHDIEVFINGARQQQSRDYLKISNTQIQFIDDVGDPYQVPNNADVLFQSRDFAVGSGANGNTIETRDEGILVTNQTGSYDYVGPFVEASETTPGDVEVNITAEENLAENIGDGVGVYKQKDVHTLQFRGIKGCDGVAVYLDGDDLCISLLESPYYVDASDQNVGLNVALPSGRVYDPGLNRLGVYRNGVRMIQSSTAGGLVDRYIERTRATLEVFLPLELTLDVLQYINDDVSPNYQVLLTGITGPTLTIPTYTVGNDTLKIWRNGLLMTTTGFGGAVDRYAETDANTITLDENADSADFFLIESAGEVPAFREELSSFVGSVATIPNSQINTPGDDKFFVYRNGRLLLNGDKFPSLSEPVDRYNETSTTQVTFGTPLDTDDWVVFMRKP